MRDKTNAPANLPGAFEEVWRKGGSAGADAQTVAHFGRRAEEELQRQTAGPDPAGAGSGASPLAE